jgi:putative tryptophan/tyrosine transport system substrate-binding protein
VRRREFIALVGGAAATWPVAARAQQRDRMQLIGVLIGFAESDPDVQSWFAAFRGALAKLGWTEGSNLRIELRWAGYDPYKMKIFAKELVDLRPKGRLHQQRGGRDGSY